MERNKKDMIFFEREAVIKTPKSRIIAKLASLIELDSEKEEFLKMCKRLEYIFRSWYLTQFEDLMQLYSIFDPSHGAEKLQQQSLSPCDVDNLEQNFLKNLFQVMEKSHFKLYSDKEAEVAASSDYLLTLPISLDESQFDSRLLTRFFQENPHENLPQYANKFVIFRRGIGIHRTSGYFIMEKVDMLLSRGLNWLLILTGHECKSIMRSGYRMGKSILHSGYWMGKKKSQPSTMVLDHATGSKGSRRMSKKVRNPDEGLYIERFRIENMDCSLRNLFGENTIQEPTFEQMVIVYRLAVPHSDKLQSNDRSIHIEHFKDIPMADMEMILPAKKNPSLTPMDLVQFLISTIVGLAALIGSLEMPQNVWVAFAISSALVGYCTNIYSTFQQNKENYQNLMTKLMYDKHLNHGRGTLLHVCHDVIIQEVKESIISLFILMQQGKTSIEDLDYRCEELLESKFGEKCDLDVVDTIMKLERLGIIFQEESLGRVYVPSVTRVNEIIGITTEEIVAKARDGLT
jgi:hypothetical protein